MGYKYYRKKRNRGNEKAKIVISLIISLGILIYYYRGIFLKILIGIVIIATITTLIYSLFKNKKSSIDEPNKKQELEEKREKLRKYLEEKPININEDENTEEAEKQFFNLQKEQTKQKLSYWEKKQKGNNYEKMVGNYFENEGYYVEYRGLTHGKKDGGIDLIAKKENEVLLIQCKAWDNTIIKQRHVIKFLGDCSVYLQDYPPDETLAVIPVFVTTSEKADYGLNQFLKNNSNKIRYIIMPLNS